MGGVCLVLLPGMDGTDVFFRPLRECVPSSVETIAVEYPQRATSYESLAELVRSSLPVDRDVFLLGWSFSGPLAIALGAEGLPQVRGLVLAASFARRPVRYLPRWVQHFARPMLFRLYPMATMAKALVQGYSTPAYRALQSEAFSRTTADGLSARVRALLSVDARPELRRCELPILYLRSAKDRVVHRSCGDEILREAPNARLVELDAPHVALATHPAEAWAVIAEFLEEHRRGTT